MEEKNYFVNFADGDSAVVHTNQGLTEEQVHKFAEKIAGKVLEVYHVPNEELQYYCIGGRVWIDTPEKAKKLLETIKS